MKSIHCESSNMEEGIGMHSFNGGQVGTETKTKYLGNWITGIGYGEQIFIDICQDCGTIQRSYIQVSK